MLYNFLYIDPGTGSMLFSLAIGVATAGVFAFRALAVKIRFILSGGKAEKLQAGKIPYLIFSDHKRYWNVFKPICDQFEERKIPLVYYTQSEDDPALSAKYEFVKAEYIGEGNKGFVKMNMLNAGTVIATTPGLDVLQWKRSKTVDRYIHIPHSCDDLAGYRMFALDYYDAFLACGQNQIDFAKKIEEARPAIKRKEMFAAGSTFLDAALDHVKELPAHTLNKEKPVILLAPSWGPSSILVRFGDSLLSALKETGFEVIVRPHPQSFTADKEIIDSLMEKYSCFEWNRDNDNLAVLNRSDMMITDFSGIILEYTLLFNRPFMYADTSFDTAVYDAAWFDEKMWILRAAEKMGLKLEEKDFGNIKEVINNALSSTSLQEARNEIKEECWAQVGNAAKNIVDFITAAPKE